MTPRLIALDWGTSSLRAWLLGDEGAAMAAKSAPLGVLKVRNGDFAAAFRELCGDWLSAGVPAIASGMIGSRQGWVEAPYVACPAGFDALAGNGSLLHRLFGARTLGLFGQLTPGETPSYLSGLLIGEEVRAATVQRADDELTLIGEATLAERYREALARAGVTARLAPPDAARAGLWRIALAADIVHGPDRGTALRGQA